MKRLTLRDHAMATQEMIKTWKSPSEVVASLAESVPYERSQELLEIAYRDERTGSLVDLDLLDKWYGTAEGKLYFMWLGLREQYPELDMDRINELSGDAQIDWLAVSGMPTGNSQCPEESPGQTNGSESLGEASLST